MRSPGSYYRHTDTGNGSGHLCSVPAVLEDTEDMSVTVCPHGKSPPAQSQSASKAQLITSTYMQRLSVSSRRKDAEKWLLE